jgi:hypothetical protein
MVEMKMATRIKLRRAAAANWTSANPILALGEPGLETDTRKVKYGDGSTAWTSLSYAYSGAGGTGTDYTLPTATGSVLGGVKVGARLSITDGVLSADVQVGGTGTVYTLPTASTSTLGGIKIGTGLSINGSGVVTASGSTGNWTFSGQSMSNANGAETAVIQTAGTLRINNTVGVTEFGASSGKVQINGSSGLIIMPNGGEILGISGAQFTLTNVSSILFGDGTRISTANLNATTSTLTAGTYTTALSTTGTVRFSGDIRLPAVNQPVTYSAVCSAVGSGQCTIDPGVYPTPQIGWFYNGLQIVGVTNISGSYIFNFAVNPTFGTGTYDLTTGAPAVNKRIYFSDGTSQGTAFDPENLMVTATIDLSAIDQDILPATSSTYNLGSAAKSWRELHVSTNTIYIAGNAFKIDSQSSPTSVTVNGVAIGGAATTDQTWTPPDATTWEIKEYNGNFSGTYTQDTTLQTYAVTPAGAGNSSTIYINRLAYSNIDAIAPKIDFVRFNSLNYNVTATVDDVWADGVIIYLQTPITEPFNLTTSTPITITYTEPGTGPLKWFDFAATPNSGAELLGGEIQYHATIQQNDGAGAFGGAVGRINFNVASNDFDQSYLPMGPATGTNYTVYTSTTTGGFSYQSEIGLGLNDRLKIQWTAKLFYNGTWASN